MDTFTRRTADDVILTLEVDEGVARISDARAYAHRGTLTAAVALKVWDEVCLFTAQELPHLIAAGRQLGRRKGAIMPGELRSMAARAAGDLPRYEPDERPLTTGGGGVLGHRLVQCRFVDKGQCWGRVERVICRDPLHGLTEQDRCEGHRGIVFRPARA